MMPLDFFTQLHPELDLDFCHKLPVLVSETGQLVHFVTPFLRWDVRLTLCRDLASGFLEKLRLSQRTCTSDNHASW